MTGTVYVVRRQRNCSANKILKGAYHLKVLRIADTSFLTAAPIEKVNLATMRKHRKKLMEIAGMECAFWLDAISAYAKKKMLEEGNIQCHCH